MRPRRSRSPTASNERRAESATETAVPACPKPGARDRVLDAARQVMETHGYNDASLNDILSLAKVSPSNFYYHFKSKEDLGLAVVRQMTEGLERTVVQGMLADPARSPLERLKGWFDLSLRKLQDQHCTKGCAFGKLSSELSDSHPAFRKELERAFALLRESLRECLREGIERGELRRGIDPGNASSLLLGSIQGLVLLAKNEKDVTVFQRGSQELFRLVVQPPE
jgi:TetR/AcrR family transcriptional repressor of nem operon